MASTRKTKPFTPDAQSTRFLYLILKQLDLKGDLKSVNWQEVADNIGIKNGHAARMRWSRFKQHAEGTPPQPKTPKPKKTDVEKNGKRDLENPGHLIKADDGRDEKRVKLEHGLPMSHGFPPYSGLPLTPYPMPSPMPMPMAMPAPPPPMVKTEPSVKQEPGIELSKTSGVPSSLPYGTSQWQPQQLPSIMTAPPPASSTPFASDDDNDDIPIRELNKHFHTTVSMADLQLSSPVKREAGDIVENVQSTGTASSSSGVKQPNADSQTLSPALLPSPTPPLKQSLIPQLGSLKTSYSDRDGRCQTSNSPAIRPEPTAMPTQAPTWFPSPQGAFQKMAQAYYPAFAPGYRPPPYPAAHGHQQCQPMSYMQRPIMHPFSHMGFNPNPTAPYPQHPLAQAYPSMQSTYPNMPYAMPRDANTTFEDTVRPSMSLQASEYQAAHVAQAIAEKNEEENSTTGAPTKLQVEHVTTLPEHANTQQSMKASSTSLLVFPCSAKPVEQDPVQGRPETASPEAAHFTACPSVSSPAAPGQLAQTSSDATHPSSVLSTDTPVAPFATFCNLTAADFTQAQSDGGDALAKEDVYLDFDFDFSAIEGDLQLPFQESGEGEGKLSREPQLVVGEEGGSVTPKKISVGETHGSGSVAKD